LTCQAHERRIRLSKEFKFYFQSWKSPTPGNPQSSS
jgi:hypothetical protein